MSLLPLLSFAGGELDPTLHDNVTLDKFKKGLATARNVIITKTGSIQSRSGRTHYAKAKLSGKKIKVYCPKNSFRLLEFGDLYVRIYNITNTDFYDIAQVPFISVEKELVTTLTEFDLDNLHFETSKDYVYVFCAGAEVMKIHLNGTLSSLVPNTDIFKIPPAPNSMSVTASTSPAPTGFPSVEYAVTVVINGEESLPISNGTSYAKPSVTGASNTVGFSYITSELITEMRVYSRPVGGGAFGLLGTSASLTYTSGTTTWTGTLFDFGQFPDFSIGLQELITNYGLGGTAIINLHPKTGAVYQQRLIVGNVVSDKEALLASRPGYQNNFQRDFPYAADSALQFKSGSSGKAEVLRIIEHDGLVVFTTIGVFISAGVLSVDNLALVKKGGWIIDESLPPLVVPGGVFFVDKTNAIRQLIFSQEIMSYESSEQTIFSNHLFKDRKIVSWSFQNGKNPVILVVFNDGDYATFTYNYEHQMMAWTRHDSKYPVEGVEASDVLDRAVFVTNKNGDRYIELSVPRVVPIAVKTSTWAGQDSDKYVTSAFMDAAKSSFLRYNDIFDIGEHYILTPVVAGDWTGNLTLDDNAGLDYSAFVPGQILRMFHPVDRSAIDLTVVSASAGSMVVTPSETFPSQYASSSQVILYEVQTSVSGLDHLEGEDVAIISDGHLITSPYNDAGGYPTVTVTGGVATLPAGENGAIIHVGRPIVADIKTLKASTVEQSPTIIESMTNNKTYINVRESIGLFVSNEFPEEASEGVDGSSVLTMEDLDVHYVPKTGVVIGNASKRPTNKRLETTIPGTWENSGQVSIRQVDPFHFEILSIINDLEIERRSDR
jgi:hypothetical protein